MHPAAVYGIHTGLLVAGGLGLAGAAVALTVLRRPDQRKSVSLEIPQPLQKHPGSRPVV
jgi:hypothetical protein